MRKSRVERKKPMKQPWTLRPRLGQVFRTKDVEAQKSSSEDTVNAAAKLKGTEEMAQPSRACTSPTQDWSSGPSTSRGAHNHLQPQPQEPSDFLKYLHTCTHFPPSTHTHTSYKYTSAFSKIELEGYDIPPRKEQLSLL